MPTLALSGDLFGDLKVWNLEKGHLEYTVPDSTTAQNALFRNSGAIVSLSQNVEIIAAAFANQIVALYSTLQCATNLQLLASINLSDFILDKNSFTRSVCISQQGQLYVCNVSGNVGIVIFDTICIKKML
jgi:hypothetical protein